LSAALASRAQSLHKLSEWKPLRLDIYLTTTGFLWAPSYREPGDPHPIETHFANLLGSRFFYRSPQKDEVDFVPCYEDHLLPIGKAERFEKYH